MYQVHQFPLHYQQQLNLRCLQLHGLHQFKLMEMLLEDIASMLMMDLVDHSLKCLTA